ISPSPLGLPIPYDALNRRREVAAERAYAPWPDLEALLRARGLPLVSLESHLPLADFHVLGFSLQYELTYTNLLTMLELGRVPLRAAARGPAHPLVIAGGPCALDRKSTRLNSSHEWISYAVFCLKKKTRRV